MVLFSLPKICLQLAIKLVIFGKLDFLIWSLSLLTTTNTILVIFELKSIRGKSYKKWNLVLRIIWTLVAGLMVILYLIQLISCTHHGRNACLIWEIGHGDEYLSILFSELFFSICLLIVGPMFLYGIFKSFLLHKILK